MSYEFFVYIRDEARQAKHPEVKMIKVKWLNNFAISMGVLFLIFNISSCARSFGLAVESVNSYPKYPGYSLSNSIANGDGFIKGMTVDNSPWELKWRWVDNDVWDRDLSDGDLVWYGIDNLYFDQPGVAISYFTGHGISDHGCSGQSCTTSSACTTPGPGARFPGICRFNPGAPLCCYMVDRAAVTDSSFDAANGVINYSSGPIRWGESPESGGWAGAGTNGGTNLVILDISHGVLPTFWYETLRNASAGVHMIATLMTAGGDTANIADRGATFARMWAANPMGNVAQAWLDTMSSLPKESGMACGNEGGHGFNGCGCHIVVAMDSTPQSAASKINENWLQLRDDKRDAKGNDWYSARWQCNYTLPSSNATAWELP
jgi:hypothetical protein